MLLEINNKDIYNKIKSFLSISQYLDNEEIIIADSFYNDAKSLNLTNILKSIYSLKGIDEVIKFLYVLIDIDFDFIWKFLEKKKIDFFVDNLDEEQFKEINNIIYLIEKKQYQYFSELKKNNIINKPFNFVEKLSTKLNGLDLGVLYTEHGYIVTLLNDIRKLKDINNQNLLFEEMLGIAYNVLGIVTNYVIYFTENEKYKGYLEETYNDKFCDYIHYREKIQQVMIYFWLECYYKNIG